tara:strand:+ start:2800 stop:4302 length:1503 start_codon:yes stop_codon:yes gene_type:complete
MSIFKRFAFAYLLNLVSLFFTFLTGIYLAKSLGPNAYGSLAYIVALFGAIFYMLDMGTSNAFFTFASKENKHSSFYRNYFVFLFSLLLLVVITFLILPKSFLGYLSLENNKIMLSVAIAAIFFRNHCWNIVRKIYDSQRLSTNINITNLIATVLYFILVTSLDNLFGLNLFLIFKIILIEFSLMCTLIFFIIPIQLNKDKNATASFKNYYKYCYPLAPMLIFVGLVKLSEVWLLFFFGGAEQQAFFSISLQFTMILVLALSSIINIFWKEIAEKIEQGSLKDAGNLYLKSAKYMTLFISMGSFFLFFQVDNIISLFLGNEYQMASLSMRLLFLYPLLQVFGQLNNVMFLASEKTKTYSKFGFFHGLCSISISIVGLLVISNYADTLISVSVFMASKLLLVDFIFMLIITKKIAQIFLIDNILKSIFLVPISTFLTLFIFYMISEQTTLLLIGNLNPFVSIIINVLIFLIYTIFIFIKYPKFLFISKEDSLFLYKKLKFNN